jgi:30S ribosomal protein S31
LYDSKLNFAKFATQYKKTEPTMGKGDIKTKRGKISAGSYGVRRKKKRTAAYVAPVKTEKPTTKKKTATAAKPAAKKTVAKKPAAKKVAAKKTSSKKDSC